jgi:transposase
MGTVGPFHTRSVGQCDRCNHPATQNRQWHSLPVANRLFLEADASRLARARKTVYHYFRQWKMDGTWQRAMDSLRKQARRAVGREEEPSTAIIDSQSIKTSPVRGIERGFDAGEKNLGTQAVSSD